MAKEIKPIAQNISQFFDPKVQTLDEWVRAQYSGDSHPLTELERRIGISAREAATRLGLSLRHYMRYKAGLPIPSHVSLLVAYGALERPRAEETPFERAMTNWNAKHADQNSPAASGASDGAQSSKPA